jgi:hypothetical protein
VGVAVVRQGVAGDDVADVLALDQHVRLADGVGLIVQFLAEHGQARVGVLGHEVLSRYRQHAAGAGGGIVDGAHHAGLGQRIVVLDEEQIDHQADHFAGGEMLPGRLVGDFRELADQLLEGETHLMVVDHVGVQIDPGELLRHQIEQPVLGQPVDLGVKFEPLEDVADFGREGLHVGEKVLPDVVLVPHQPAHIHGRGVVETLARRAQQERLGVEPGLGLVGELGQHRRLGRLQHAVQTPQHRERQDHLAVVRLPVVAPQQVGDRPDEGRKCLMVHVCSPLEARDSTARRQTDNEVDGRTPEARRRLIAYLDAILDDAKTPPTPGRRSSSSMMFPFAGRLYR